MNRKSSINTWKIEYDVPALPASLLSAGYSPLLSLVLASRGIRTSEEAERKLFCDSSALNDPFRISGMEEAVLRIAEAKERGERCLVYGDYDVDGITATAILSDYLRSEGISCEAYIPDREDEGYGLNNAALDKFKAGGISLVITVDCGITAIEEAAYAQSIGVDMIITDHHECRADGIPEACAVIDCHIAGNSYPNPDLAGVGVAFKLICACSGDSALMLSRYSDLVAIGTIADVMPLTAENRFLVREGLECLRAKPRPGISAMLSDAGADPSSINASSIGFTIAPRLNAAGRLGRAIDAVELLLAQDDAAAADTSSNLCALNKERQRIENAIWSEANSRIEAQISAGLPPSGPIVLESSSWHQGVIGIAASRLAEQYSLPTIMICMNGSIGKGSCRSYGGFNLFEALQACSEHLISFGGHALAAGLNIELSQIENFRRALGEYYSAHLPEPCPDVRCDVLISDPALLTEENVRSLDSLEPFGNGNLKPVMCMSGAILVNASNVGNGRHLKMTVSLSGSKFDAICFGHTLEDFDIAPGDCIDLAFTPVINEFRGRSSVQLNVSCVRKHDSAAAAELCEYIAEDCFRYVRASSGFCPERPDFIKVWRSLTVGSPVPADIGSLLDARPAGMIPETFCLCLEVFRQAGLLTGPSILAAVPVGADSKADLEATALMKALRSI